MLNNELATRLTPRFPRRVRHTCIAAQYTQLKTMRILRAITCLQAASGHGRGSCLTRLSLLPIISDTIGLPLCASYELRATDEDSASCILLTAKTASEPCRLLSHRSANAWLQQACIHKLGQGGPMNDSRVMLYTVQWLRLRYSSNTASSIEFDQFRPLRAPLSRS